jgi:hypothetical protein
MAGTVLIEDAGTNLDDQQDRTWLDAANLLAHAHNPNAVDYQVAGFGLTPDYGVPEVAVASGMAKLTATDVDTLAHGDGVVTWPEGTVTVLVESETLALTDGEVNEIFVDVNFASGDPDDVQLVAVDQAGSAPAAPALKVAEVDTANDTATSINEDPDAVVDALDAGDVTATSVDVSGEVSASEVSAGDRLDGPTYPDRNSVPDKDGFYAVQDVDGNGNFGIIYRET